MELLLLAHSGESCRGVSFMAVRHTCYAQAPDQETPVAAGPNPVGQKFHRCGDDSRSIHWRFCCQSPTNRATRMRPAFGRTVAIGCRGEVAQVRGDPRDLQFWRLGQNEKTSLIRYIAGTDGHWTQ